MQALPRGYFPPILSGRNWPGVLSPQRITPGYSLSCMPLGSRRSISKQVSDENFDRYYRDHSGSALCCRRSRCVQVTPLSLKTYERR